MAENNNYRIRPYARLLTMLGEQLIKDERIALIELIKNSYDADADWVKITFVGFEGNYKIVPQSKITIEDSGEGMTMDIILNHWLNPATPVKIHRKEKKDTTKKGRVIQGEKGIGRFALLKLGRKITIVTRTENDDFEHVIDYDFSAYDDDFLNENGVDKDLFLDELSVSVNSRIPEIITERKINLGTRKICTSNHGTYIEISDLKGSWSEEKVKSVYNDISRLEPIFSDWSTGEKSLFKKDFEVLLYRNDMVQNYHDQYIEKLNLLLNNRSVISIDQGFFDADNQEFSYQENGKRKSLGLHDPTLTGLLVYKRFSVAGKDLQKRIRDCGSFRFGFYIFDFGHNPPLKYQLDKEDKKIIKAHRIYLLDFRNAKIAPKRA